ncbi:Acyl-CoA N-acyltransferases (Nat) [Glarea lozoyensis ATCC 20868]|uniref:Acyl-CoA N-acyltransferases (Nat) n=1 Tax=Glarea lozoyensis (strain ATCC 20868 / MF5171) TaxID=1116229 RepID=S3CL18_GLAL2|nr:Acyl-CoA N-acyltransferases (Nat) [Glarea lozoyensis ATCC 20868]EPE26455.1 Acyl-CoA N-acyltransferases (Nat) [Glarea lozoyensis ATCC 20868]
MDGNNTNSPPSQGRSQPSIRSFFQPRSPSYTAPPTPPISANRTPNIIPTPPRSGIIYAQPPNQNVLPKATPKATLPPQAAISRIQEAHIQPLRRINSLLLPINYPDSFYHSILAPSPNPSFSRVITWTDPANPAEAKVVGGIVCRLDPTPASDFTPSNPKYVPGSYDLYIQSLALLSPYRGKGLAAAVLEDVIASAASTNVEHPDLRVAELYAHVWSENTEAAEWYTNNGFARDLGVLHGYYRKLKPDTAWIFRRKVLASDHLKSLAPLQQAGNVKISAPISPALQSPPTNEGGSKENAPSRPSGPATVRSFQDKGPDREWNDLPEDVVRNPLLKPPSHAGSTASSRSSSRSGAAGKKKRQYPTAAFGS